MSAPPATVPSANTAAKLLQIAAAACAAWFIVIYIYVAFSSLTYPFQLEWIEGQSMDAVRRASEGKPIYNEPSLEYVALIYTPLFYYVAAFASLFTGMEFSAGRIVSILATFGTITLFYCWVRREGGHWLTAVIGAGLLFGTYRLSGRWFDLARVDSLAMFFLIAGLYALRHGTTARHALITGALIAAAFFTKQTTLGTLLPVCAATILVNRRFGLSATAAALALLALCIGLYQWLSDGWFGFFAFKVASGHTIDNIRYASFWKEDIWQERFVFAAVLLAQIHWWRTSRKTALFYSAVCFACLFATYASRLHLFGYLNNLMPLHAVLALLASLGLASQWPGNPRLSAATAILLLAQFYILQYDPKPLIPTEKARLQGEEFIRVLASYPGTAYLADIQFISPRAGKKNWSQGMAAFDIYRANLGRDEPVKQKLAKEVETAIAQQEFDVIIPGRLVHHRLPLVGMYYQLDRYVDFPEGFAADSFHSRRAAIYVPKHSISKPPTR
jgi:hypothetical protein